MALLSLCILAPHSLAGTIVGWGDEQWGGEIPDSNDIDFVDIAGGNRHSLALKSDGSIVAWGPNNHGEGDLPASDDYIDIAAGAEHSVAIKSAGSIVAWGQNYHGQCDVSSDSGFVKVAAGNVDTIALKSDGSLAGWGYFDPNVPTGNDYIEIAAGYNFGTTS